MANGAPIHTPDADLRGWFRRRRGHIRALHHAQSPRWKLREQVLQHPQKSQRTEVDDVALGPQLSPAKQRLYRFSRKIEQHLRADVPRDSQATSAGKAAWAFLKLLLFSSLRRILQHSNFAVESLDGFRQVSFANSQTVQVASRPLCLRIVTVEIFQRGGRSGRWPPGPRSGRCASVMFSSPVLPFIVAGSSMTPFGVRSWPASPG